jgi:hypothetical protein
MLLLKAHGGDLKVERKVNEMGLLFNFAYYGKVVRGVASPHIVTTPRPDEPVGRGFQSVDW